MPLSANLLKLESSILPRAKRVSYLLKLESSILLAPNSPGAEMFGAKMSSAETAAPNRQRRSVPDPKKLSFYCANLDFDEDKYMQRIEVWYNV